VPVEVNTYEHPELQYQRAMARLLEEEKKEVAIRSAQSNAMRPYEVDALLFKYIGMQWYVTGNGNIAYSNRNGELLFTDRGSRVTFDRVLVSDEDTRVALVHAQQKFGGQLILTGSDPVFTARMACLADDMGITILNPGMQQVIANHRNKHGMKSAEVRNQQPTPKEAAPTNVAIQSGNSGQHENFQQESVQANDLDKIRNIEQLRTMVLAIDPRAEFLIPDKCDSHKIYIGPVAAAFTNEDSTQGFAQHLGRSVYALHPTNAPTHHNNANIEIQYCDNLAIAKILGLSQGKDGDER